MGTRIAPSMRAILPWVIAISTASLLVVYSLVVPLYQAPDEAQHIDLVLALHQGDGWPDVGERTLARQLRTTFPLVQFSQGANDRRSTADIVPRDERPSLRELSADPQTIGTNHAAQHPPLYYLLLAIFSLPFLTEWRFDQALNLLRLTDIAFISAIPLFAFFSARRLGLDHAHGLVAALFVLGIPQLLHIGGSVSNDTLLAFLFAALFFLLSLMIDEGPRLRTDLFIGGVAGLAALTKAFGLLFPVVVAGGYALASAKHKREGRPPSRRNFLYHAAIAIGVGALISAWWWARNLALYGRLLPPGLAIAAADAAFTPDFRDWAGIGLPRLVRSYWGQFGHLSLPLPGWLWGTATAMICLATIVALMRDSRTKRLWWRAVLAWLLLPTLVLALITPIQSWRAYTETGRIGGLQGRYLFIGLVGVGIVAAIGWIHMLPRTGWGSPVGWYALLAAFMHLEALHLILTTYWGSDGPATSIGQSWTAFLAGSPWPECITVSIVSLSMVLLLIVTVLGFASRRWSQ